MEERLRFVFEYEREECTMTEHCGRFEISRETGKAIGLVRFPWPGLDSWWIDCAPMRGNSMQMGCAGGLEAVSKLSSEGAGKTQIPATALSGF